MSNEKWETAAIKAEKRRTKKMLMVLVPITVIVIALTILVGIMANKAGGKSPVSADKYAETSVNMGYETLKFDDEFENIEKVFVTKFDEENNVFFFEFKNKDKAKLYFAAEAREMKRIVNEAGKECINSEELENYWCYEANVNGKYMHIIRVKDTVLYADVDEKYMDDIKKIVQAIGY